VPTKVSKPEVVNLDGTVMVVGTIGLPPALDSPLSLTLRPCPYPSHAAPLPILAASTLGAGSIPTKLKWTVLTDRSIGGKSEASFEVLPAGDGAEEEKEDVGAGAMTKTERRIPLAVFSGQLSTVRPSADPKYVFCGLCHSLLVALSARGASPTLLRARMNLSATKQKSNSYTYLSSLSDSTM